MQGGRACRGRQYGRRRKEGSEKQGGEKTTTAERAVRNIATRNQTAASRPGTFRYAHPYPRACAQGCVMAWSCIVVGMRDARKLREPSLPAPQKKEGRGFLSRVMLVADPFCVSR